MAGKENRQEGKAMNEEKIIIADIAYMAGFFDGEGCISLTKLRKQKRILLFVRLAQCNEWIIRWFQHCFGGKVYCRSANGNQKEVWVWQVAQKSTLPFLRTIEPYLILKRAEAQLAIKFQEGKRYWGYKKPDRIKAVEEAQRILMHSLKDKR